MVRKTKEDAALTRQRIIDAAREVFLAQGVSRSSLEQVAKHAGVTRGAVYWHFDNKHALFNAMREQVFLPLIDRIDHTLESDDAVDPLDRIRQFLCDTIEMLNNCQQTRQTYEVMMTKCEYVGDFSEVLHGILKNCDSLVTKLEHSYAEALAKQMITSNLSARALAMDTHLFFGGLLHMWVKNEEASQFRQEVLSYIDHHISLRRSTQPS